MRTINQIMGFFSRLFQSKPEMPTIVHPIFGRMNAVMDHGEGRFFWEMPKDVETSIGPISVCFDAGEAGPTSNQVEQWQSIVADFEKYCTDVQPLLLARMREFGHDFLIHDLKPTGFGFYNGPSTEVDWDVSFDLPSEGFLYTVCFKDGKPIQVHADS
jgi:hypothetical protein